MKTQSLAAALLVMLLTVGLPATAQADEGGWFIGGGPVRYTLDFNVERPEGRSTGTDRETGGEIRLGWRGPRHRFHGGFGTFSADDYRLQVGTLNADVLYPVRNYFKVLAGGSLVLARQNWDSGAIDDDTSAGLGFQIGVLLPLGRHVDLELAYRQLFTRLRTDVPANGDGDIRYNAERIGSTHLHINIRF
ncbi:opacity protein-like surface antigen [Natronocella acetinitrilica]|uniref:Opacity protein-like surface antigen n=1 Tax=Natronocella acetinitrilica TaxID=414046 RepID=A0AAE3KBV1_9GAMM|nr:outer membrane beta-barrel protein [Natronocella acetinitrilica]MCP1675064.1 opacity protein-like surface antigen [Natronocella acetinitrilica]